MQTVEEIIEKAEFSVVLTKKLFKEVFEISEDEFSELYELELIEFWNGKVFPVDVEDMDLLEQ
jgi:predicted house-cleaning noncanonical NTP pyrophosphatase (MazG superfamily)